MQAVQCEIRYFWVMALCLSVNACSLLKRLRAKQSEKDTQVFLLGPLASSYLTHCGAVTQICVFTLQLCKTDNANLRF